MRNLGCRLGLSLVLWNLLGASVWGAPSEQGGTAGDKPGLTIFPARDGGGGGLLDPGGFEVHLTPQDDPEQELVYPCGQKIEPPPGRYRFWIQGEWRMSPYSLLLGYSGRGPGLASLPVVDAGRVTLPSDAEAAPGAVLELFHAGSYLDDQFPRWEISPRKAAGEIGEGLLMPVGRAFGALWDRKNRRYVALSRPFTVGSRKTVTVPLERPQGLAHLVVRLERRALASTAGELDADLSLQRAEGELAPDLKVTTADRIYAVWYELAPGPAELHAQSGRDFLPAQKLDLLPGAIESVRARLQQRPALDVELDLPAALGKEGLTLAVRRLPSGEVVARQPVGPTARSHRFEDLPPALLAVDLETGAGSFSRQVDLSSGADGFVLLAPELVTVRGTVFHGDQGHPAKLTFTTVTRAVKEVQTDEEGSYEVALVDPVRFVEIELAGVENEPYADVFSPPVAASRELDFHLPKAELSVRVLDAVTGRGIAKASVLLRNTYVPAVEDGEEEAPEDRRREQHRVMAQDALTDETGVARLPPLRQGTLEIRASAEGYLPLPRPVETQVIDGKTDQVFDVRLEPLGETAALRLRLPEGAPAAGAEVSLVGSLLAGPVLFSARADEAGLVEIAREQAGFLLVKHPAAAFLVREWQPADDEGEVVWELPALAGRPLTVRVKTASGEGAAASAELALWVEGRRLEGSTLGWLTSTRPVTDANGYWTGTNLPQSPLAVLAWEIRAREEAWMGNLDSQATSVGFPWPDPVEVRVLQASP